MQHRKVLIDRIAETPLPDNLLGLGALILILFTRRRPGFELIGWKRLFATVTLLAAFGYAVNLFVRSAGPVHYYCIYGLAAIVLVIGITKRQLSWIRVKRGHEHTCFHGVSYLNPFTDHINWSNRFIDPLAGLFVGWVLYRCTLHGLGVWVIFAAISGLVVERTAFHESRDQQLAFLNSQREAGHLNDNVIEMHLPPSSFVKPKTKTRQKAV